MNAEDEDEALVPAWREREENVALGAAWRRCEAALPEFGFELRIGKYEHGGATGVWADAWCVDWPGTDGLTEYGTTPAAALTALAEALEARKP